MGILMRIFACMLAAGFFVFTPWITHAEEIGTALKVDPKVLGYLPGEQGRDIHRDDAVERGLKVELEGEHPYLLVGLNFGGKCKLEGPGKHQFTGTARLAGRSTVSFGDLANLSASTIGLALGRLWLAWHSSEGDGNTRCTVDVDTPHARIPVLGTCLRVLVDSEGTFVAVDEGTVKVQSKAGGEPVEVKKGQWVRVPVKGPVTRPAPPPPRDDDGDILQDPLLLGCCDSTEQPKPPGE
jgi:hypothetical protein